ncbi:hypothetical protein RYA05_10725 [Pseudomonas syringae pv. actinidiae]|uniref:Asp-tRNAAsn/Glu-tRNAGln amidotransferase B subunit n=4 Tax=Pseudomonas syringae group TaxID=136849 RepID=A0A2V0Q552_PSESF|nr:MULTISPECIES: hypothetical protein [Pseudomonas syringae group]EPN20219.1 hypothetical protein A259_09529 [Pseudomonas syringae pv. actinidiae ICMP 19070]EPN58764.1 hypothetical protein A235_28568 [Pseudomonas syringae pv. actinidiae ICMP 19079]EPN85036.1 hypothetical protein A234_09126 [Pseudomonas syringae pv. actinidiae ICMP 19101]AKT33079.1 hypothetical protein IYO_026860 [Pseudomonas syringae pv. actinidiae ICMP 18884]AOE59371.1 hypothetical protein NZ708_26730 [Pseudomonas syringae pv
MEELRHHLQQLPGDLQAEIAAHVGDWGGMNYIEITDKHIHAANHLISSKRALVRPTDIEFANTPKEKMRTAPGNGGLVDLVAEVRSFIDSVFDSVLVLENFKRSIEDLLARLLELGRQHAERLAQEAAQRQAEEAARRHAEEQAAQQRAIEAALQLAQRQVEEAEHALALRNAEETRTREAESRHAVEVTFGPEASREIDDAIKVLRGTIEIAITDFSNAINPHGALDMSRLETIQNMSTTH